MNKKSLLSLFIFLLVLALGLTGYYLYKAKEFPWQGVGLNIPLSKKNEYQVLLITKIYNSSNESDLMGTIAPGKFFKILRQENEWLNIQMTRTEVSPGAVGWIKTSKENYKQLKN